MPGGGNFDATRHLQRRPRYATVPAYGSSLVLPSRVKFCHLAHPNKVVCTLDLTLDMPLVEVLPPPPTTCVSNVTRHTQPSGFARKS